MEKEQLQCHIVLIFIVRGLARGAEFPVAFGKEITKLEHSLFMYKTREINTFAWSSWVLLKPQLIKHRGNGAV